MHLSGLVITLDPDSRLAARAMVELVRRPGIELGERAERRIAVALEAADAAAAETAVESLRAVPGILAIDVAFAEVSVGAAGETSP